MGLIASTTPSLGARRVYLESSALADKIGFVQRVVLSFLVIDVVNPGARFGQVALLAGHFEIGFRRRDRIRGAVQRIFADRFRIQIVSGLLLVQRILSGFQSRLRGDDLRFGHVQSLFSRLRLQFFKQSEGGLRLRLQLLDGGPLDRIVDQQQNRPFLDLLAFGDQDLLHGARHLRVNVDVLAARLIAFHDAFGIDAVGIRIGGGTERRRQRRLGDAGQISDHASGQQADERQCE